MNSSRNDDVLNAVPPTGTAPPYDTADRVTRILERVTDGFCALDRDWRITYLNREAARLLGRSHEELLGELIFDISPDFRGSAFHRHYETVMATGRSAEFEARSTLAPDRLFRVNAYHSEDGLAIYFNDVTARRRTEDALRESEERHRALLEGSRDAIYTTTPDGRFIEMNPACHELLGITWQQAGTLNSADFYADPLARKEFQRAIERDGRIRDFEVRLRRTDGTVLDCLVTASARRDADGRIIEYQGIIRDITEQKQALEALEESQRALSTLMSNLPGVAYRCRNDRNWTMELVNEGVTELTGYSPDDFTAGGKVQYGDLIHPDDRESVWFEVQKAVGAKQPFRLIYRLRTRDGDEKWVWEQGRGVYSDAGETVAVEGFILDITERKHAEERLKHDALHDALTSLPNRALFMNRLKHAMARASRRPNQRFAILYLDLDRFKVINDSLGHLAGDRFLTHIARRLEHCVRPTDTVARLGGDEFAILLDEADDLTEATRVAERIQQEIAQPIPMDGHQVASTCSLGIALSGSNYVRPDELLRDADIAMYRAKAAGRHGYAIFDAEMHVQAVNLLRLESDLRTAIESDQLEVHYQPVFDLAKNRLVGFESLLRWNHPERGWLEPDAFIPLAEETGLIVPIGRQVVAETCRQLMAWRSAISSANGLSMSVNLSARQLADPGLVDQLRDSIEIAGAPPEALHLEITESVVMQSAGSTEETLAALKALGIGIWIDDFGTGYSSLSYLNRFPIDALKIDRMFITRLNEDAGNLALVRTILDLTRSLNIVAVSEGVETADQLATLRTLGCAYGQGYFFSPPLEPQKATAFLKAARNA